MKGSDCWGGYGSPFVAALAIATTLIVAPSHARAVCAGDCDGSGNVVVGEVVTLVNIALETAQASTCPQGIPSGATVNITLVVQGVNSALVGCGGPGCGNGVPDAGEDCDNGGTCIGGTNAGTHCTSEAQCQGDGVCLDGVKEGWGCSSTDDCPGSSCIHCKTFGGKGCAANCTSESDVNVTLVPGDSGDGTMIVEGTSGLVVNSAVGITVGIPYPQNTVRTLTIGKEKDSKIPMVLKFDESQQPGINQIAGIDVLNGSACICLKPVIMKTCGGTLWEKNGTPSQGCSAGYTAGDSVCPATKPCTFAYGEGNGGAGQVGCTGLAGVNVTSTQDSGGSAPLPNNGPVLTTREGDGVAGSAILNAATELGFIVGQACTGTDPAYGGDGKFCSGDDPKGPVGDVPARGVLPQVLTTGNATATVIDADPGEVGNIGPFTVHGAPASCSALAGGSASGAALAGAFPDLDAPTVMDIIVTNTQVGQ